MIFPNTMVVAKHRQWNLRCADLFSTDQRDRWALLASTVLMCIDNRQISIDQGKEYLSSGYRIIVNSGKSGHVRQEQPVPRNGYDEAPDIVKPIVTASILQRDLIYQIQMSDDNEKVRGHANLERRDAVQRVLDSIALSECGVYYLEFLSVAMKSLARVAILHRRGCQNMYIDDNGRTKMVSGNVCSQRGYLLGKTSAHFDAIRVSGIGFPADVVKAQTPFVDILDGFTQAKKLRFHKRVEALCGREFHTLEGQLIRAAEPIADLRQGLRLVQEYEREDRGPYILIRVTHQGNAQPFVITSAGIYDAKARERMNAVTGKQSLSFESSHVKRWYLAELNFASGVLTAGLSDAQLLKNCPTAPAMYSLFANFNQCSDTDVIGDLTRWLEGGFFDKFTPPQWISSCLELFCSVHIATLALNLPSVDALQEFLRKHIGKLRDRGAQRIEISLRVKQLVKEFGPDRLWSSDLSKEEKRVLLEWIEEGFMVNQTALELSQQSEEEFCHALGMVVRRCGFASAESLQMLLMERLPASLFPEISTSSLCQSTGLELYSHQDRRIGITDIDFVELLQLVGIHPHSIDLSARDLRGVDFSPIAHCGARLDNVDFSNVDLSGANFSGLSVKNADFTHANLANACFANTDASHADFNDSMLADTDFSDANLQDTIFDKTYISEPMAGGY